MFVMFERLYPHCVEPPICHHLEANSLPATLEVAEITKPITSQICNKKRWMQSGREVFQIVIQKQACKRDLN